MWRRNRGVHLAEVEAKGGGAAAGDVAPANARSWYRTGVDEDRLRLRAVEAAARLCSGLVFLPLSSFRVNQSHLRGLSLLNSPWELVLIHIAVPSPRYRLLDRGPRPLRRLCLSLQQQTYLRVSMKILTTASTSVSFAPTKCCGTPRCGLARFAGPLFTFIVSRNGTRIK